MLEAYGYYFLIPGLVLLLAGYFGFIVAGFRTHWAWGVGMLVPVVPLLFVVRHFGRSRGPLLLSLLGVATFSVPVAVNRYQQGHLDLGPYEKQVEGEKHLTLTGWDRKDYAVLMQHHDAVVLQMANPDVDDATLANLSGMEQLRELDLNETQVTDAGLAVLARLPRLRTLRLKNTAISLNGFREQLAPLPNLQELDLRGTTVPSSALRAWKAENPERRYLR